jgi:alpha-ketoglutarate-dependent taurine dioxygenase
MAAALLEPFPVDRKGETPPGKKPTYAMPVFHLHPSASKRDESPSQSYSLSGIYDRSFVDAAQSRWTEADGVARLTQVQVDALDALDATCADDAFRLDMRLEPGDAQWLHNHTTFHARSAYERGSDRHLLRVWVAPENARRLPAAFAERFGDLEPGPNRGGIRVEGQTPYCALEPGG